MNRLVEDELNRMEAENEKRMNVIAQNGNEGLHYDDMTEKQQWQYVEGLEVTDNCGKPVKIQYELDGEITEIKVNEPEVVKPTDKAQLRKDTPVFSGVLKYFPNALKAVARASKAGNDQHHPDKPLHWDMSKSKDEYDAMIRHLLDHENGPVDDDNILHLTKVAWRALAGLERYLTNNH